jgi:hypothetical protein
VRGRFSRSPLPLLADRVPARPLHAWPWGASAFVDAPRAEQWAVCPITWDQVDLLARLSILLCLAVQLARLRTRLQTRRGGRLVIASPARRRVDRQDRVSAQPNGKPQAWPAGRVLPREGHYLDRALGSSPSWSRFLWTLSMSMARR